MLDAGCVGYVCCVVMVSLSQSIFVLVCRCWWYCFFVFFLCMLVAVCSSVSCLYYIFLGFFFFKQKTAYEMRISDWSSDVCSSDVGSSDLQVHRRGCQGDRLQGSQHPAPEPDRERQDRPEPHHRHQVALPAPARHRRQARALPGPDSVYGQPQHLNASSRREDTDFLPLQGEGFKHESRPFGDRTSTRLNSSH